MASLRPARWLWSIALLWVGCAFTENFDKYSFEDRLPDGAPAQGGGGVSTPQGGMAGAPGGKGGAQTSGGSAGVGGTNTGGAGVGGTNTGGAGVGGTGTGGNPAACVDPCLTDAVLNFNGTTQGSGGAAWRYQKDTRDPSGLLYVDLAAGNYLSLPAWVDSSPPPAIAQCAPTEPACTGLSSFLLTAADAPQTASGGDPALSATATEANTYQLSVNYRVGDTITGSEPLELLLSRNGRNDLLARASFVPSMSPQSLSAPADVLPGDRLFLTVRPGAAAASATVPTPLGISFRISRWLDSPPLQDCEFAATFDDPNPMLERCKNFTLLNQAESMQSPTTGVPGPAAWLGQAREFRTGAYIDTNNVLPNYSADFTVELWARIDSNNYWDTAIYTDWWTPTPPATPGGVTLELDPDPGKEISAEFLYPDPGGTPPTDPTISCSTGTCTGTIQTPLPGFGSWHFYRMVRDTGAGEVRFCIDGQLKGKAPLSGTIDISARISARMGMFNNFSARAQFNGAIDDIRIFRRLLPCG